MKKIIRLFSSFFVFGKKQTRQIFFGGLVLVGLSFLLSRVVGATSYGDELVRNGGFDNSDAWENFSAGYFSLKNGGLQYTSDSRGEKTIEQTIVLPSDFRESDQYLVEFFVQGIAPGDRTSALKLSFGNTIVVDGITDGSSYGKSRFDRDHIGTKEKISVFVPGTSLISNRKLSIVGAPTNCGLICGGGVTDFLLDDISIKRRNQELTYDNQGTRTTETVIYGRPTIPPAPTRAGYIFLGWKKVGENQIFDFSNTPITADTTFEAQWREAMTINTLPTFYVFYQGDSWSHDLSQHINSQVGLRSVEIIKPTTTQLNPRGSLRIEGTIWTGVSNAGNSQPNRRLRVTNLSGETAISDIFQIYSVRFSTETVSKTLGDPVTADEIYDRVTVSGGPAGVQVQKTIVDDSGAPTSNLPTQGTNNRVKVRLTTPSNSTTTVEVVVNYTLARPTITQLPQFYLFKNGDPIYYDFSSHVSAYGEREDPAIVRMDSARLAPLSGLTIGRDFIQGNVDSQIGYYTRRIAIKNATGTGYSPIFRFHSIGLTPSALSKAYDGNAVSAQQILSKVAINRNQLPAEIQINSEIIEGNGFSATNLPVDVGSHLVKVRFWLTGAGTGITNERVVEVPVRITDTTPPVAQNKELYFFPNQALPETQLSASDNVAVTAYEKQGQWPSALSLSTDGKLTGSPTQSANLTFRAKDAANNPSNLATLSLKALYPKTPAPQTYAQGTQLSEQMIKDLIAVSDSATAAGNDLKSQISTFTLLDQIPTAGKNQTIRVQLTNAIGQTVEVPVTVSFTTMAEENTPLAQEQIVPLSQTSEILPINSIQNSGNLNGKVRSYTWKTTDGSQAPSVNPASLADQNAKVIVTYTDGSIDEVDVVIKFRDDIKPEVQGQNLYFFAKEINPVAITSSDNIGVTVLRLTGTILNTSALNAQNQLTGRPGISTWHNKAILVEAKDAAGNYATGAMNVQILTLKRGDLERTYRNFPTEAEILDEAKVFLGNSTTPGDAYTLNKRIVKVNGQATTTLPETGDDYTVTVRFENANGQFDEVDVEVTFEKLNTKYAPTGKPLTKEIHSTLDIAELVDVTGIPAEHLHQTTPYQRVGTAPVTSALGTDLPGKVKVIYRDGTSDTVNVKLNVVDTQAPICGTFTPNTTDPTNANITMTMAGHTDAGAGIVDNQPTTCEITDNGQICSIVLSDKAGHTVTCVSPEVNNIDRISPTATITADKTDPTNQNVILTMNTSEELASDPAGWTKIAPTQYQKTVSANENITVNFTDKAGNPGTTSYNVTNIDKVNPEINGQNLTFEVGTIPNPSLTDGLTATDKKTASDTAQPLTTPISCAWKAGVTYNPDQIGNYEALCEVTDPAGNKGTFTRTISVTAIDKTPLQNLKDRITADFADRADKILNPEADDQAIRDLQTALDNPNLTAQQMNDLIAKYTNLKALRDTTNPSFGGTADKTFEVGSDLALAFANDLKSDLTVADQDDQGQPTATSIADVTCQLGTPAYDANIVGSYTINCQVTDAKGNQASLTRTISVVPVDKQKLRDLLQRITADFDTDPSRITNEQEGIDVKNELQTAINNQNLTSAQRDALYERLKNTLALRDTTNPEGTISTEPSAWTNQSITLTLTTNEPVQTPDGWTPVNNSKTEFTKTFDANTQGTIKVRDLKNNESVDIAYIISKIDKDKPVDVQIRVTGDAHLVKEASVQLNFSANDTASGVKEYQCLIGGNWQKCADPANPTYTFPLTEGLNTLKMRALDHAGNLSDETSVDIRRDSTAPTFKIKGQDGDTITTWINEGAEWDALTIGTDRMTDLADNHSASANITTSLIGTKPATASDFSVSYTARDEAGNTKTKTELFKLNQKPIVQNLRVELPIKDGKPDPQNPQIFFTPADATKTIIAGKIEILQGGTTTVLATVNLDAAQLASAYAGRLTSPLPVHSYYTLKVTLTDEGGLTGEASLNYPPAVTFIDVPTTPQNKPFDFKAQIRAPNALQTISFSGPFTLKAKKSESDPRSSNLQDICDGLTTCDLILQARPNDPDQQTANLVLIAADGISEGHNSTHLIYDKLKPNTATLTAPTAPLQKEKNLTLSWNLNGDNGPAGLSGANYQLWKDGVMLKEGSLPSTTQSISKANLTDGVYTFKLQLTDRAGNSSDRVEKEVRIDATLPTLNITNANTDPAQSKTVSATADDNYALADSDAIHYAIVDAPNACQESQTLNFLAGNAVTLDQEVQNGKFVCFKATDKAGNVHYQASAQIAGIDRTNPTATIIANKTAPTNQDVILTMETSEPLSTTPDGWTKISDTKYQKTVPANENITVNFTDRAGNAGSTTYNVTNIDKEPLTGEVAGEPIAWTNVDRLTLTLKTKKPLANTPQGWNKVDDKTFTKEITNNETSTFTIADVAGNTADITYNVSKIDRNPPTLTLTTKGNKNLIQESSIQVEFSAVDTPDASNSNAVSDIAKYQCRLGNTGTWTDCSSGYEFTNLQEGVNTLRVKAIDNAGNETSSSVDVTKDSTKPDFINLIDHTFPEDKPITAIQLATNEPATIEVKSQLPAGLNYDPATKQITGIPTTPGETTLTVEATDLAGNKREATFKITITDVTKPEMTLTPQIDQPAREKTYSIASVSDNHTPENKLKLEYLIVASEADCENSQHLTFIPGHSVTLADEAQNGKFVCFKATDEAGNSKFVSQKIEKIDRTAPFAPKLENQRQRRNRILNPELVLPTVNADGESLSIVKVENLPAGLTYTNGKISGTPTKKETKEVTVSYVDRSGNQVEGKFSFVIYIPSDPAMPSTPVIDVDVKPVQPIAPEPPKETKPEITLPLEPEQPVVITPEGAVKYADSQIYNPMIENGRCYTRRPYIGIKDSETIITSEEFKKALSFLRSYEMTMYDSVDGFDPYRNLSRQEAAKLFSQFAINVLCRKPDLNLKVNYSDTENADPTLKPYIELAYQLGVMKGSGLGDGDFRPFDYISKAEVNAVLIRMILKSYLDENQSIWYSEYNEVASQLGIIHQGAGAGTVSRNDVSLMLFRAYKNQVFDWRNVDYLSYVLDSRDLFLK